MSEKAQSAPPAGLILTDAEAGHRMLLLAELKAALVVLGVDCVLARNHRLVLRYNDGPCEPSGLLDPDLHIFTPEGKDTATTDGSMYRLASGGEYSVADPSQAAAVICHSWGAVLRA